jgi:hypothetical protein
MGTMAHSQKGTPGSTIAPFQLPRQHRIFCLVTVHLQLNSGRPSPKPSPALSPIARSGLPAQAYGLTLACSGPVLPAATDLMDEYRVDRQAGACLRLNVGPFPARDIEIGQADAPQTDSGSLPKCVEAIIKTGGLAHRNILPFFVEPLCSELVAKNFAHREWITQRCGQKPNPFPL